MAGEERGPIFRSPPPGGSKTHVQDHVSHSKGIFGDPVPALKRENQRLLATNNGLQLRILEMSEQKEVELERIGETNRKLREKICTVTFLLKSQSSSLKEKEKEVASMRDALRRIANFSEQGTQASYPQIIISEHLGPSNTKVNVASEDLRAAVAPQVSEDSLLHSLQHRLRLLESELDNHKKWNQGLQTENGEMKKKMLVREEEVKRLATIVETERNWDRMEAENTIRVRDFEIQKLNDQLDVLNETKSKIEHKMDLSSDERKRIVHQERELRELEGEKKRLADNLAKASSEIESLLHQMESERSNNKSKIVQLQRDVTERDVQIADLQDQMRDLRGSDEMVRDKYSEALEIITKRDKELQKTRAAASEHGVKMEKLQIELQRVLKEQSFERLRGNEFEMKFRDLLSKHDAHRAQALQTQKKLQQESSDLATKFQELKVRLSAMEIEKSNLEKSNKVLNDSCEDSVNLEAKLGALQADLAQFRSENTVLSSRLEDKGAETTRLLQSEKELKGNLRSKQTDNSKLILGLQSCQRQLNKYAERVKAIALEKERLRRELRQASAEVELQRQQLMEGSLRASEREADLKRLQEIKDALEIEITKREGLIDDQRTEIQELEIKVKEAKEQMMNARKDAQKLNETFTVQKLDANVTLRQTRSEREMLEAQVKENKAKWRAKQEECKKLQRKASELDVLCRQNTALRAEVERQLARSRSQVEKLQRETSSAKQTKDEIKSQILVKDNEIVRLGQLLKSLDQERDKLQHSIDTKDEELAALKHRVHVSESSRSVSAQRFESLTRKLEVATHQLNEKQQEVKQLRNKSVVYQSSLTKAEEKLHLYSRELNLKLEDLAHLTKENQLLSQQIRTLHAHDRKLAKQVAESTNTQTLTEQRFHAKERELRDVISTYKAACLENQRLKVAMEESEKMRSKLSINFQSRGQHVRQLQVQLQGATRREQKLLVEIRSYEAERERLTEELRKKSDQLHGLQQEHQSLGIQAVDSRNAAAQLRQAQVQFQAGLAEKEEEIARCRAEVSRLAMELERAEEQFKKKDVEIMNLERVIASTREQLFETQARAKTDKTSLNDALARANRDREHAVILNQTLRTSLEERNTTVLDQNIKMDELKDKLSSFVAAAEDTKTSGSTERLLKVIREATSRAPVALDASPASAELVESRSTGATGPAQRGESGPDRAAGKEGDSGIQTMSAVLGKLEEETSSIVESFEAEQTRYRNTLIMMDRSMDRSRESFGNKL